MVMTSIRVMLSSKLSNVLALARESGGEYTVAKERDDMNPRRKENRYEFTPEGVLIELTQGRSCLIDREDLAKVLNFKWLACRFVSRGEYTFIYAMTRVRKNGPMTLMHRFLLNAPKDMVVHHRNGNTLDNRRCNLEVITRAAHMSHHGENQARKERVAAKAELFGLQNM